MTRKRYSAPTINIDEVIGVELSNIQYASGESTLSVLGRRGKSRVRVNIRMERYFVSTLAGGLWKVVHHEEARADELRDSMSE
ncbi:MAG TPA: hypothetical protein ENJ18_05210 [Nannocystis exedens]|nr:hypothetical protein [Nannocystis exedens]